jgi:ParB/RepB/Spo0J family partition protein
MKAAETHVNYHLETKLIYADANFNCRGRIDSPQLVDIASSIKTHGLQIPIIVWKRDNLPNNCEYMLIAGYRRFQACTELLRKKTILATVRTDLTNETARILNFTENLERKNLNILEESRAIALAFPLTLSDKEVGRKLNRGGSWVRMRRLLMRLPESAQKAAAAGHLLGEDIQLLNSVPEAYREKLLAKILDARKQGRSISYEVNEKRGNVCNVKPNVDDIKQLILYLTEKGLKGLCIKILSYMLGRLSSESLYCYIDSLTKSDIQDILDTENTNAAPNTQPKIVRKYTKRGGRPPE